MVVKRVYHALENQDNCRATPDAAGGTRERVLRLFGGLSEDGNALHEDRPRLLAQFAATGRCAASYLGSRAIQQQLICGAHRRLGRKCAAGYN